MALGLYFRHLEDDGHALVVVALVVSFKNSSGRARRTRRLAPGRVCSLRVRQRGLPTPTCTTSRLCTPRLSRTARYNTRRENYCGRTNERASENGNPMRRYHPRESWRATEHLRSMSQAFNVARAPRALRVSLRLRPRRRARFPPSAPRSPLASGPLSEGPTAARPLRSLPVAALAR